jgi:hypothetical protein
MFKRKKKTKMETDPVNNPLDYRRDGSIRKGDPAWDFMMKVMEGNTGTAVQREDGTWDTNFTPIERDHNDP